MGVHFFLLYFPTNQPFRAELLRLSPIESVNGQEKEARNARGLLFEIAL